MMFTAFCGGAGYRVSYAAISLPRIAGFVAAMTVYGSDRLGRFNITHKWIVFRVICATMFSMGTKLTIRDFIDVAKMPWAVLIGTFAILSLCLCSA